MPELINIRIIAEKEFRDALRNRWFLLYTLAFAGLALGLSTLSQPDGLPGSLSGYGRTAASLVNLVLLFVPLVGLTLGAMSVAGDRETGSLSYLLAQPITRTEILLGKYLGLAGALFGALCLGFGIAAGVLAGRGAGGSVTSYLLTVALACLLGLAMLSLGLLISVSTRKTSVAMGSALFLWLFLAFIGDLGLMGTAVVTKMPIEQVFWIAVLNPLQLFKMSAILTLQAHLEVLGPAGIYATRQFSESLSLLLVGGLFLWVLIPLGGALTVFAREG